VSVAMRYKWDWFATLTFSREYRLHPETVEKLLERWFKELRKVRLSKEKFSEMNNAQTAIAAKADVIALGAVEGWPDNPHVHLLVGRVGPLLRTDGYKLWEKCGYSRIYEFSPTWAGLNGYCFKYVLDGGEIVMRNVEAMAMLGIATTR